MTPKRQGLAFFERHAQKKYPYKPIPHMLLSAKEVREAKCATD